jgi:DNA-binding transcriptional LysR family regulator
MRTPVDLRVDLHLIHVLGVLINEQSVTRAAVRLNLTQPAVSIALRKLRTITGDKILVRGKNGYVLTRRAQSLLASSRHILNEFENMVSGGAAQNATIKQSFSIGSLNYGGTYFFPNLIEKLTAHSPNTSVHIKSIGNSTDIVNHLENGDLDCAITNWPSPPPRLHSRKIYEEDLALIMPAAHPLTRRKFGMSDVLSCPHVAVISAFQPRPTVVDEYLHRQNLRREIRVTVPAFSMVPAVLLQTGFVAITGRSTAQSLSRFAGLVVHHLPMGLPKARLYVLWHARDNDALEHRRLRKTIADVWSELVSRQRFE